MSKEDIKVVKIQTCVLKVNIHCDGCKQKVKKLLQKIEGVYSTTIDAEQGKVTVSGDIDSNTLIKKLQRKGKHAELWPSKGGNNQLNKQFQGMQIGNGKGQKDGKPQKGQQQLQLQPPQLQQMKGLKDLKLPQFGDMKLPFKDKKSVKFNLPDDDGDGSDDGFDDDYDDDFDFDADELKAHLKMKAMNNGQLPMDAHLMNGKKGSGGGNGKKGGGDGDVHVQNKGMGGSNDAKNGNGGKKGAGNNGGGQNQGGGGGVAKNGGAGGGGNNKVATNGSAGGNNNAAAGGKKGGGGNVGQPMTHNMGHGFHEMGLSGEGGNVGQMGNIPAVQRLPAAPAMNAGGYFQGAGPEIIAGNPYYQHAAAAMMMQQRQNGMYARPPMPVAYMPQPPPHAADPYTHYFSDENANGCAIM